MVLLLASRVFGSSFSGLPTTWAPHSAQAVSLTGVGTAWNGSTVFTVSGATKTGQTVSTGTSALVQATTLPAAGTVTISDGTSTFDVGVDAYKVVQVTTGGVPVNIYEPAQYTGGSIPLVYYHHGATEDRNSWTINGKIGIFNRCIADGYLLAGISAGENWGAQPALTSYSNVWIYLNSHYTLNGTVIFSQSMGGCAGLLNLRYGAYPNVKGWIGIFPVCNLSNLYGLGTYTSEIDTAYGISGDYAAKTAGFDPVTLDWSGVRTRMRFYHSPSDTVVPKAQNTDVLKALVSSYATESDVIVTSGNHGDASSFQPSDFAGFLKRCFYQAGVAGAGGLSMSGVSLIAQ